MSAERPSDSRDRASYDALRDGTRDDVLDHLAQFARLLERDPHPRQIEALIVECAVNEVPGADHASISVADRYQRGRTIAASSDLATLIDALQYREREGPCLDTLAEHVTVRSGSLSTESRWPHFGPAAARAGVHSTMSVHLFTNGRDHGALNLFGEAHDAFTDGSERVALALGAHAAVAVAAAARISGLRRAVRTRDVIGQAKGILMERHRLTSETAFAVLVRYSRDNNVKLVDVAEQVVGTGRLPDQG